MANEKTLDSKVVVITGATSGFGRGAAIEFARHGAFVVLAARRDDLLNQVAHECESAGVRSLAVPTDVGKPREMERLAAAAVGEFGLIDVWVNNAGAGAIGLFEEIPLEDHVRVIETDLLGALYGSYYAMRQFKQQGYGTLINVASIIGKTPSPYFSSYAAAKAGVVNLSAVLRQELQEAKLDNIHVSTIEPTSFDTPFFEHAARYTGHRAEPIPPVYDPKDVVDTIVRMALSPENEVRVGTAAKVMNVAHHLFPGLVESMMARQTRKAVFDEAPPASESSQSLHEPIPTGTSVYGDKKK